MVVKKWKTCVITWASRQPETVPIVCRAYARVGLMGNPSDGFHGKTISLSISNFWAEATIFESERLHLGINFEFQHLEKIRVKLLQIPLKSPILWTIRLPSVHLPIYMSFPRRKATWVAYDLFKASVIHFFLEPLVKTVSDSHKQHVKSFTNTVIKMESPYPATTSPSVTTQTFQDK